MLNFLRKTNWNGTWSQKVQTYQNDIFVVMYRLKLAAFITKWT